MTHREAIEIIEARDGHAHGRYRFLCSEANPDAGQRAAYRAHVVRRASRAEEPAPRVQLRSAPELIPYLRGGCCGG